MNCAPLGRRFPFVGAIHNTFRITWKDGDLETISMVGLKTTAQFERYASGIFDNQEKTLDNKAK